MYRCRMDYYSLLLIVLFFIKHLNADWVCQKNKNQTDLSKFLIVDDFEAYAEKCMPKTVLAYVQSGAMLEQTLAENRDAFMRFRLQHKVLRDTTNLDISTTILGHKLSMPIGICPNALQELEDPEGEKATARAAFAENTLMILGSRASYSMEEVANSVPGVQRWFQVGSYKNRTVIEDLLKRAKRSGYTAIVLTVDSPIRGDRITSMRLGFSFSNYRMGNLDRYSVKGHEDDTTSAPYLKWSDLKWIKSITGLPIILKGILTAEDAELAVENGANAVFVSNHGGRQLDGVPATIEALPDVVRAVNGRVEVYLDGGVRTGSDVVKALALGARAVFIGRPNLYGLFAGGVNGSQRVLQLLRNEFQSVMHLIGAAKNSELDLSYIKKEEYYQRLRLK